MKIHKKLKILIYMEAQGKNIINYPIFEGELNDNDLHTMRKELRKAVVKIHTKIRLQ